MSKIGIDIDSTLYHFEAVAREEFMNLAKERGDGDFRGSYVPWVEWRSPADATSLEDWLEVIDRVHNDEMILKQSPFPESVETCWELVRQGHELMYLSNRKTESERATAEWLTMSGFPEHQLIVTMDNKKPYLDQCQYLIDDRPKTLVEFIYDKGWKGEQRQAYGLMFEYNRSLTDIPNIYLAPGLTWSGIRYYLMKTGVLKEKIYA